MGMDEEVEMEIFRTGDYGAKGAYTQADLQRIAEDYRPDLLEAPLTFDHAQTGPAYGWVSRLKQEGDRLVAVLKGVPEAVREMVRSGAYKRRSVELFRTLPHTGRPYLRAVSLLGAATPEVKGLRDICFAAAGDACQVELAEQSEPTEPGLNDAAAESLAAVRSQLQESRLALMFSELRADGYHVVDRDVQAIGQLLSGVIHAPDEVRFSDATTQPALDWLSQFLRQNLLRTPLGETAGQNVPVQAMPAPTAQFSERTDPRSLALHNTALQIQSANPGLAYREALSRASRRG